MRLPSPMLATLGEQLDAALEEAIIDGELAPGQRLNADDIAEQFGVSRIPVREALRSLHANGWVEIRPRHGVYVRRRTAEELLQLFEVRETLEITAARLAARRRTREQLDQLTEAAERCLQAAERGEPDVVSTRNFSFHTVVAAASGNEVLASMCNRIGKRVRWYYKAVAPVRGLPSAREHLEMVEALRAGDADVAARVARGHVIVTRELLERLIAEDQGSGRP